MVLAANLGYPRLGAQRELKRALEQYWSGKIMAEQLRDVGKNLRVAHWQLQRDAGIDVIPSNDFSFYDGMLDTAVMVGAIPPRYEKGENSCDMYFAMARGAQRGGLDVPAMEMTKWFDTNYHYIVPEIEPEQTFQLHSTKAVDEFKEAQALGIHTRPVLIGPVTFLLLSKSTSEKGDPLAALPQLLPVYVELLKQLEAAGADWVQMDEPALVLDLPPKARDAFRTAYNTLTQATRIRLMLASYFGALGDNLALALNSPVAGLHLDLVRAPQQLETILNYFPQERVLSVGVVNGRNVWRTDLDAALGYVQRAVGVLGSERVQVAPSSSLLFSPHDLTLETELDPELYTWLAFARQKLDELVTLKRAANEGIASVQAAFDASRVAVASRRASPRTRNPEVRSQMAAVDSFRLAVSGVLDETQIHTHMCYSEFNDIIKAIGRMDADVISIEASRSNMELLAAFNTYKYPNAIGPGVYDIHSPRVPSEIEMYTLIQDAAKHLSQDQLWLNPDCGLKTRNWEQVTPALENMVAAARQVRAEWNGNGSKHE